MPYEWIPNAERNGVAPLREAHLWPHRSLPKRGFAMVLAGAFVLFLLPLFAVVGSPVLWGLLPFLMGTLVLLYWAIARSYRDGEILEELRIWPDRILLERHASKAATLAWEANPHWVEVTLHPKGGPVENYVTLRGGGREVEIGAFLSDDERVDLYDDLARLLPLRE